MSFLGFCANNSHISDHPQTYACVNWRPRQKSLPITLPKSEEITESTVGYKDDEVDALKKRVHELERELAGAEDRYFKLNQIYNKLADQWNVFQATTRPDNRNIQRAEGAGEMARKLAEVLLSVAYSTDARELLKKILEDMEGAGGREVEVTTKLVRRPDRG